MKETLKDLATLFKEDIEKKNISQEEKINMYTNVIFSLKENILYKNLSKDEQKQLIYEILIDEPNIFAFNVRETFMDTFQIDYLVYRTLIFDLFARMDYYDYFCTKNDSQYSKIEKANKWKKVLIIINKIKKELPHLNDSQVYCCIQRAILCESEFSSVRKNNCAKRLK